MTEARADQAGHPITLLPRPGPSPVFLQATRLFNAWLIALDALVTARSPQSAESAQTATAALLAHLGAHPDAAELAPVRARLVVVFERLRQEEAGGAT